MNVYIYIYIYMCIYIYIDCRCILIYALTGYIHLRMYMFRHCRNFAAMAIAKHLFLTLAKVLMQKNTGKTKTTPLAFEKHMLEKCCLFLGFVVFACPFNVFDRLLSKQLCSRGGLSKPWNFTQQNLKEVTSDAQAVFTGKTGHPSCWWHWKNTRVQHHQRVTTNIRKPRA